MSLIGRKIEFIYDRSSIVGEVLDKVEVNFSDYRGEPAVTAYLVVTNQNVVHTVLATKVIRLKE